MMATSHTTVNDPSNKQTTAAGRPDRRRRRAAQRRADDRTGRQGAETATASPSKHCFSGAIPGLRRLAHGRLPAAARGAAWTRATWSRKRCCTSCAASTHSSRGTSARCRRISGSRSSTGSATRCVASPGTRRRPSCPTISRRTCRRRSKRRSRSEAYERYRAVLVELSPRDRQMVVARIEAQWNLAEIAQRFNMRTVDGARMAVTRALRRLMDRLKT